MAAETGRSRIITSIEGYQRLLNTHDGNPRWKLITRFGTFETAPDSQVGYQPFDAWSHVPRPRVELTLNGAGKVIGAERIGD